jgi:MFS family permease
VTDGRWARTRFSPLTGLWLVTAAFTVGIGVSAVPTPLYALYEQRDDFGTSTVTVVFAAFSLAVAASLVLAGPISDRIGRRRALVPALLLDAVSGAVFIVWPALPGLLLGRILCGLAVGVIAATSTAYLGELHAGAAPGRWRPPAEILAAGANLGGVGLGSLAAGVLAEWAPQPLRLSYAVYLVLLLVLAALVAGLPEPPVSPAQRGAARAARVRLPDHARRRYLAATAGALLSLATLGLFASLVPTFLVDVLHRDSHALAGLMAFVAFVSAAVAQVVLGRLPSRTGLAVGCALLPVGLTMLTTALWTSEIALFVAGGAVTGSGGGLVFKRCLGEVAAMAPDDARAASLAGVYLASYLGLALAVVGLGLASHAVDEKPLVLSFSVVTSVAVGVLALERLQGAKR